MSRKSCEGCRYYRYIATSGTYLGCHYMLDTGKSRGCDPAHCTRYAPKKDGEDPPHRHFFGEWEEFE